MEIGLKGQRKCPNLGKIPLRNSCLKKFDFINPTTSGCPDDERYILENFDKRDNL
jgi:hypothetical protein